MYRTLPVITENNILQGEARHLRFASRSALSGLIYPIMTGVLCYNIIPYIYHIYQVQTNMTVVRERHKNVSTFVNAIGVYTVHSDYMIGIDLFRLEIESDKKCLCKCG